MKKIHAAITGIQGYVPDYILNNKELEELVDTNDEWIVTRTGIKERRILKGEKGSSDLGAEAIKGLLDKTNTSAEEIDLIICATVTPDMLFPSTACLIADKIGAGNICAFDISAACSGFLYALTTASKFIESGSYKKVIVVGCDKMSSIVDYTDRTTCVLFGDGAGAVALESSGDESGLIGYDLKSDGSKGGCLNLSQSNVFLDLVQGANHQKGEYLPIKMEGKEVYKFAVKEVPIILGEILEKCQIKSESIDWLLLHQANQRILDAVASRFSIPSEKVLSNLKYYGNTSAATIPLMLDEAVRDKRIKSGDLIACSGFGAGLSWGAALFYWHGPY